MTALIPHTQPHASPGIDELPVVPQVAPDLGHDLEQLRRMAEADAQRDRDREAELARLRELARFD